MAGDGRCQLFGDRSRFAVELRLLADQPRDAVPVDSVGTWGAWRLFVSDVNLCRLQLDTVDGVVEVNEVRWFLAPLIRWLVKSWAPLLHEAHLPDEGSWGDRRPRWARLAYLAMLERSGDDIERFRPWQQWAARHALRSAAEGGIVPDVFFQRVGDEIEFSWGDRIQPGGEAAAFLVEDGVARAHVEDVADALRKAVTWFFDQGIAESMDWAAHYADLWRAIGDGQLDLDPLHWYLDSRADAGPLSTKFLAGLAALDKQPPQITQGYLGSLSPEIAMFGDLTPMISQAAAVTLLTKYYSARSQAPEPEKLAALCSDEPAWTTTSPWENGYALALDVLDEVDPDPGAPHTDLKAMLQALSITVEDVALGREGPRGVALAGPGLRPTLLVNIEHPMNLGPGRTFTEAHEFCHVLFDRHHARPLAHSSTPWASPSVEQRANAFAAMLLMPPNRARRPAGKDIQTLSRGITILAGRLKVSRVALLRHLSNVGEVNTYELDQLLGASKRNYGETKS